MGSRRARLPKADRVIDGRHAVVVPGLVNTHHHLYQTLTRAYAPAADAKLFDWLRTLYPIWARLDEESRPRGGAGRHGGVAALGLHHHQRPSLCVSARPRKADRRGDRGGAAHRHPVPSHARQHERGAEPGRPAAGFGGAEAKTRILADCERLIAKYHDPAPGSMLRIALAPCSPFSVSPQLMRASAELARRHGVRLHTHLAETRDEEAYCLNRFGKRPLDLFEDVGWLGGDTWLAHGIHFNRGEIARLGRAGVGIAHCPTSNMRLGSGMRAGAGAAPRRMPGGAGRGRQRIQRQLAHAGRGAPGAAAAAAANGAAALGVRDALRMATVEGARCLGRDDIGTLEPGKRADIAMFDLRGARLQRRGRRVIRAAAVRARAGGYAGGGRTRRGGGRRAADDLARTDSRRIAGLRHRARLLDAQALVCDTYGQRCIGIVVTDLKDCYIPVSQ